MSTVLDADTMGDGDSDTDTAALIESGALLPSPDGVMDGEGGTVLEDDADGGDDIDDSVTATVAVALPDAGSSDDDVDGEAWSDSDTALEGLSEGVIGGVGEVDAAGDAVTALHTVTAGVAVGDTPPVFVLVTDATVAALAVEVYTGDATLSLYGGDGVGAAVGVLA